MSQEKIIEGISECCTAPTATLVNRLNKEHKLIICTKCKKKLWEHRPELEKVSSITVFDIIKEKIKSIV